MVGHVVSCIPNEVYPFDPTVVESIRKEFDPTFIPVFVKNVFRTGTGGYDVEYHHACAAATPLAERTEPIDPMTYRSLQPTYEEWPGRPTRVHLHLYARDPKGRRLRGQMVPFEWNVYWFLRTMRNEMKAEELKELVAAKDVTVDTSKAVSEANERAEKTEGEDASWLRGQLEAFDVTDWKRVTARGIGHNPNPATRPSVYVGKENRT